MKKIFITLIKISGILWYLNPTMIIAQDDCSGAGSGSTTTKSGGTVSGTETWNSTNWYLVTGNYNITGTLYLTEDVFYEMSEEISLTVKNGGHLYITGSTLYVHSGNSMWNGIKVEGGGYLNVVSGTDNNATIAHAFKGVEALADIHGEAEFHITGTTFCNNEMGIYVGPYTAAAMNSEVYDTEFTAPYLYDPRDGQSGDYGIYVNGLNATAAFQIGDDEYYTGSTTYNNFHDLNIAIRSDNSYLVVQDNFISNLIGNHSTIDGGLGAYYQTGILATSTTTTDRYLQIGLAPDLVYENMNNVIRNARKGVFCRKHVDFEAYSDSIYSTAISDGHHFVTDTAVHIETDCQSVNIQDMDIENFNCFGILSKNNSGADPIHLEFNHIFESISFANDIFPTAIAITENTTNPVAEVYSNQCEGIYRGILLNNIDDAILDYNIINYEVQTSGGSPVGDAIGIALIDCDNATIQNCATYGNWVSGYGHHVRGIFLNNCPYFDLYKNRCDDAGDQIALANTSTGGQLHCNQMNIPSGANGIYCYNIGSGAAVLANPMDNGSGLPSGNYWLGPGIPNRITCAGTSDLSSTTWLINPSPGQYDIPTGTCTGCPTISTDGDANCESYFRLDQSALYDMKLSEIEVDYALWAFDFNNGMEYDSPESWYNLYGFWRRIKRDSIQIVDLSDTLLTFYENISQLNIPLFDSLSSIWSFNNAATISSLLNDITPFNDIEYYWKYTSEIYLNSLNTDGEFNLSTEDRRILKEIAELGGYLFGTGVYQARAMLDTIIIDNGQEEIKEAFKPAPIEQLRIFPNPSETFFIIDDGSSSGFFTLESIIITNVLCQNSKFFPDLQSNIITVNDLPPGIYSITTRFKSGPTLTSNIIISR